MGSPSPAAPKKWMASVMLTLAPSTIGTALACTRTCLPSPLANASISSKAKIFNVRHKSFHSFLCPRGVRAKLLEGVQDWSVTSAPAKVAVQYVVDLLHGGVRVLLQEGVQLHHHAGAAESTLGSSVRGELELDWMVVWLGSKPFHGGDLPARAKRDRSKARINAPHRLAIAFVHRDDTSTTATLVAGDLGPCEPCHLPDIRGKTVVGVVGHIHGV